MGLGYVEEKGGEVMGGDFLALPFFLSFFLLASLRHILMFGNEVGWLIRNNATQATGDTGYIFAFYTHSTSIPNL